jgi:hypothetical protein
MTVFHISVLCLGIYTNNNMFYHLCQTVVIQSLKVYFLYSDHREVGLRFCLQAGIEVAKLFLDEGETVSTTAGTCYSIDGTF